MESEASLKAKVAAMGLGDLWSVFQANGWNTFAAFAFSVNYIPGNPDDSKFVSEVVEKLLPSGDLRAPAVRRLFYESYALYIGDLKQRTERTESDAPRKLVVPEREARRKRLAERVTGVHFEGELDVAYFLVDKCPDV